MSQADKRQYRGQNFSQNSERVYVDKSEVRAAFRGKEAFSLHDVTIRVKVPYDAEINQILNELKARWVSEKKYWELPVGKFPDLKPHIDKINDSVQLDWHDRVNKAMREYVNDKRIFVEEADLDKYQEGKTVFENGRDWLVTYVGRKKVMGDNSVKAPVYLEAMTPTPIDNQAEDRFS